ncbi:MAG: hypothetical protein Q8L56_05035 [Rhodocyclaceae bacterium]|nr:hypothetical protein [Rhodocyclaceae bacterium]
MTKNKPGRETLLAVLLVGLALFAQTSRADSRDALFSDDDTPQAKAAAKPERDGSGLKGFVQFELAHTTADPTHWSKLRTRGELIGQGSLGSGMKWKASARLDYDAVFEVNADYPAAVARNQRATAALRETYLDVSAGDWDFRLGRQHVVWGEMVGLFFADVVSARDLREFILPEFDMLRTPQWAARAEYFKDDFHAELLWVPVATYDAIGKPGAEFYPYQPVFPGFTAQYKNEVRPTRNLSNGNYGIRLSTLKNGWDFSGFYYRSMDIQQTFYREIVGTTMFFEPRHDRISQVGGTVAKDFGSVVLKGEAVYTRGRKYGVLNLSAADGLVAQNTLDWAAGLDFTLPADTRFNVQLFQRVFFDHDPAIIPEERENGYSLYLNRKIGSRWEAQATFIASLNRTDWLFRPRVQWNFEKNWRLLAGIDIFKGPPLGMFGQYANRDRVYSEVRYSF